MDTFLFLIIHLLLYYSSLYLFFFLLCWCECLALKETGISLCVRNLTAQITRCNETWQATAAVQKVTVLRDTERKGRQKREKNVSIIV